MFLPPAIQQKEKKGHNWSDSGIKMLKLDPDPNHDFFWIMLQKVQTKISAHLMQPPLESLYLSQLFASATFGFGSWWNSLL